jgi:hypothetical protein
MNTPNLMEKSKKLLVLLGRFVSLVAQVLSLYSKFHK